MKRVLVVDDDQDILTLVEIVLTMHDFQVETLLKWENIEERILAFSPNLILLDVALNGADGRDICKKLKASEKTKNIPVILFSAHADVAASYRECNAQGFIAKPFEIAYLIHTLESNLESVSE